jgi:hypothetical protein
MGVVDKLKSGARKVGSGIKKGAGAVGSGAKWGAGKAWGGAKAAGNYVAKKNLSGPGVSSERKRDLAASAAIKTVAAPVVAGAAVVKGTFGAAKYPAFVLLFLGFLKFLFFNDLNSGTGLLISIFLFFLSGYALASKLGRYSHYRFNIFLPMIYFIVWYFVFKGNIDPEFLLYFIGSLTAITLAAGLFTKGRGVFPELVGFVPAIFFFLDVGMLPFLVDQLNLTITPFMEGLLIWMPWWSLLGLFTLPEDVSDNRGANAAIGIVKILGYMYIIFIFVSPWVPDLGYTETLLPSTEEISDAQQNIQRKIPTTQNPAIARFVCMLEDIQDVEGCVKRKQAEKEIELFCIDVEGLKEGTESFEECKIQEKERRKGQTLSAQGTIDRTIKIPTSAKIIFHKDSFPQIADDLSLPFPIELQITNPRRLSIFPKPECKFKSISGDIFNGEINVGSRDRPVASKEETFSNYYLCRPDHNEVLAPGRYTLIFEVVLEGLETESRLQRAFVGSIEKEDKIRLVRDEISKVITIKKAQVPAEFAGIFFDLGHIDDDPIIEYNDREDSTIENKPYRPVILKGFIKNMGNGKILNVKDYNIDLQGITPQFNPLQDGSARSWQGDCTHGSIPNANLYKRDIPIPTCFIEDFPEELKNPDETLEWVSKEFRATLKYDYLLDAKQSFELIDQGAFFEE